MMTLLCEDMERVVRQVVTGVVESQTLVESGDGVPLLLGQIEGCNVEVLRKTGTIV